MEEIVTCKLETYEDLIYSNVNLKRDNEVLEKEINYLKENLNKLCRELIEENLFEGDFKKANITDIKVNDANEYICYVAYKVLRKFFKDDEIKSMLVAIKEEQANEKEDD